MFKTIYETEEDCTLYDEFLYEEEADWCEEEEIDTAGAEEEADWCEEEEIDTADAEKETEESGEEEDDVSYDEEESEDDEQPTTPIHDTRQISYTGHLRPSHQTQARRPPARFDQYGHLIEPQPRRIWRVKEQP